MMQMRSAGTYALILENESSLDIRIGRRGNLQLIPGFYIYIGSAFGPGGIPARTARHKKIQHSPHWHIDYLRKHTDLTEIWFSYDTKKREHQWAKQLEQQSGIIVPMAGFGSSDCQCTTHLFFSWVKPDLSAFSSQIKIRHPDHFELYCCAAKQPFGLNIS